MHKSVALWSHPRSMSTALERMFIERGDFRVFHEEFAYVFFMNEQRADIPHKHADPGHPQTYPELRDMMEDARTESPVFHKDFPYHALEHLLQDPDYLRGQVNTFLIRQPEESVLSHANVHPGVTREVLGYSQLATLFDYVRTLTGTTPVVIDAADLAENPHGTIAAYCHETGIDFRPDALSWQEGDRPEWSTWREWHTDAAGSSGFQRPNRNYRLGFEELPHLRGYIEYCRPFYDSLRKFRLQPESTSTTVRS